MNKGLLLGPFFIWKCGDQERSLVQENAPAFWMPGGRPEGVRIGLGRSESILPPLPTNRKPGLAPGFFVPAQCSLGVRFTAESGHRANIGLNDCY
jgi:hypothetical protein